LGCKASSTYPHKDTEGEGLCSFNSRLVDFDYGSYDSGSGSGVGLLNQLLELMLLKRSKKNTKCVNAVNEELTDAKHNIDTSETGLEGTHDLHRLGTTTSCMNLDNLSKGMEAYLCSDCPDSCMRFSWVFFLASKDETASVLKTFIIGLENLLSLKVKIIRCDNGTEFKFFNLNQFCELKDIKREFSVPRTPQQNGITERKNKTLIEAARTLLADSLLPIPFWAEAVNTACYVQNRVLVTKPHNKTPYELLHVRLPSISFMRPFGCPVIILNTLDPLGKFQGKVDEGFLVGYSVCSKAFRVFNSRTRIVQETLHVNFMENKTNVTGSGPAWLFDIDSLTQTMNYLPVTTENQTNTHADSQINNKDVLVDGKKHDDYIQKSMSLDIHSSSSGAQTRNQGDKTKNKDKGKSPVVTITRFRDLNKDTNDFSAAGTSNTAASPPVENSTLQNVSTSSHDADMPDLEDYTHSDDVDDVGAEADINNLESTISEPKRVHQALKDPSWIEAMQEELLQFKLQKVWILVDLPYGK
nr:putative ribonuclease H-like domain-containing protein [Tanacetum cinerariifolium]